MSPRAGWQTTHSRISPLCFAGTPKAYVPASPDLRYPQSRPGRASSWALAGVTKSYAARAKLLFAVGVLSSVLSGARRPEHAATASLTPSKPARQWLTLPELFLGAEDRRVCERKRSPHHLSALTHRLCLSQLSRLQTIWTDNNSKLRFARKSNSFTKLEQPRHNLNLDLKVYFFSCIIDRNAAMH
jgi:hypothetical protein